MDLANISTVEVLDLLGPMDEFGVIAVDSTAHTIVNTDSVEKNNKQRNKILSIDSAGGGIFVYEALLNAGKMISKAEPQTKHIILFADAADSEQPGNYIQLLEKFNDAGITVSVIGLGKVTDKDAGFLFDIAERGKGQIYFTQNAMELPRLFAQDTFVAARSTFIEEPVAVKTTAGLYTLTGRQFQIPYKVGGYNLCYPKENANLAAVTTDEYSAPFVAAWQTGIGRAVCYTGQADGKFTGDIVNWDDIGSFFSSLARWTAGKTSKLGEDMLLRQKVESGIFVIELHLDPERKQQPFLKLPTVTTLSGKPGQKPNIDKTSMNFETADMLTARIPLEGAKTYLSTVQVENFNAVTLPATCLPYSPEFRPADYTQGQDVLEKIAEATNGKERFNLTQIWKDIPKKTQSVSLSPWLLSLAIIVLLLEVLERRTGVFTGKNIFSKLKKVKVERKPEETKPLKPKEIRKAAQTEEKPEKEAESEKEKTPLFSALSKARKISKSRTIRKNN
jgi:hypothetical protein